MVTEHRTNDGAAPIDTGWHTAVVDGLRVAYEVRGSGALVIAHSGGPGADPASLRRPEVERTATAVSLDSVGTGRSDHIPDGDYSHATYARTAAALIRSLPGGRAVFFGHSHHSVVALQLAPDHPEVIDDVVVYDGQASNHDLLSRAMARIDGFVWRFAGDPVATEVRAAWDDAVAQEASDPSSEAASDKGVRPVADGGSVSERAQLHRLTNSPRPFRAPAQTPTQSGACWPVSTLRGKASQRRSTVSDMDRRYDAVAVLRLVGAPVIFTGLWLLLVRADFPAIASWINVVVSVILAVAGIVLVLVTWARFGGYRPHRTLRRWVRGGPDPTEVPLTVRLRFLRQQSAGSLAGGWLFLALGVLWLGLAIPELIKGQQRAVLYIATAALWALGGTSKILFVRH